MLLAVVVFLFDDIREERSVPLTEQPGAAGLTNSRGHTAGKGCAGEVPEALRGAGGKTLRPRLISSLVFRGRPVSSQAVSPLLTLTVRAPVTSTRARNPAPSRPPGNVVGPPAEGRGQQKGLPGGPRVPATEAGAGNQRRLVK